MNRNDILRMAKEAGFETDSQDIWITNDGIWSIEFERFAAFVAAAERFQCIRELQGLLNDIELLEVNFTGEAENEEILAVAVEWGIARLKGKNLGDDDE